MNIRKIVNDLVHIILYIFTIGTWVHCNDARVIRCSPEDVLKSQAYVLFYARRTGRSPVLNRFNNTNNDRGIDEPPPCKISRRTA